MRYITDSNGYLQEVSFGADIVCNGKTCTEYTGTIPGGYSSLVAWFTDNAEHLYRWKVAGGQITLDSSVPVRTNVGPAFAPAGYGLGASAKALSDLNQALKCGWYCYGYPSSNTPFAYGAAMTISRYDTGYVQLAFDVALDDDNHNGAIAKRVYNGTVWSNWEYINPPIHLGVEYRTTERWNGKPVYAKLIDCGALPNNTYKQIETGTSGREYISLDTIITNGSLSYQLPMLSNSGIRARVAMNGNKIEIITTENLTSFTGKTLLKYTKD